MSKHTSRANPFAASRPNYEPEPDLHRVAVVYYIEFGNRIKIGTSRNLPSRLKMLTYDRLLAIEPGSHALEHLRHLEFHSHRVNGEWFADHQPLRDHIATVLTAYGDPRAAYLDWVLTGQPRQLVK